MNKKVICSMMIVICLGLSGCKALNTLGKIAGRSSDNGTSETSASSSSGGYDSLPYHWINDHVFEGQAAEEARDMLLRAADEGDKETFKKCFSEEIRSKHYFDQTVDEFFASYPGGFLTGERQDYPAGAGGRYEGNDVIRNAGAKSFLTLNGKWYRIDLSFCYENTKDPDKVGVTQFKIRNLEAMALYIDKSSKNPEYEEDVYLLCDIRSEEEVSARLVNGNPVLWTETDTPKITEEEMRRLLTEYRDLGAAPVRNVIGEPNYYVSYSNSASYYVYYELAPKNGEPRYARICAESVKGSVIDAYVCGSADDTMDFDDPLCPWIKPT